MRGPSRLLRVLEVRDRQRSFVGGHQFRCSNLTRAWGGHIQPRVALPEGLQ